MTDAGVDKPLLVVRGLTKHFPVSRGLLGRVVGRVHAVDDVSFEIAPGETLGLVGESGCGKSTVGRLLVRLLTPSAGEIVMRGTDIAALGGTQLRAFRREVQIIFQDPYSSLNPRMRVMDIVGEALQVHGLVRGPALEERVAALLTRVGVAPAWMSRFPHEFSGGQRQRIGIARALALDPKLIVCDEAVSALDVSIQAQILNLLAELRAELGISLLFISHDLSVVRHISDRVAVMYLGELVEVAPVDALFESPLHPYSDALLAAVPDADPLTRRRDVILEGEVPSPLDPPSGCRFHTRCPVVMERCSTDVPDVSTLPSGRLVRCHHATDVLGEQPSLSEADAVVAIRRRVQAPEAGATTVSAAEQRWATATVRDGGPARVGPGAPAGGAALEGPVWRAAFSRRTVGHAALVLAALCLLFGAWGWGALAVLLGGVLVPGRLRRAPGFIVVLLLAFWLSFPLRDTLRRRQARADIAFIQAELAAQKAIVGSYPQRLSDLGWRLYPRFQDGAVRDPWGRPYRYAVEGAGDAAQAIVDYGPQESPQGGP